MQVGEDMIIVNISKLPTALKTVMTREVNERVSKVKEELGEEILRDTENFVPYDTGHLTRSGVVGKGGDYLAYTASYATYVYNMSDTYDFKKDVHSQATPQWLDASYKQNYKKWANSLRRKVLGK